MEIVVKKPERQLFDGYEVKHLGVNSQCNTFINEDQTQLLFIDEQDYCIICIDTETVLEQGETFTDWGNPNPTVQSWEPIQLTYFEYKSIKI